MKYKCNECKGISKTTMIATKIFDRVIWDGKSKDIESFKYEGFMLCNICVNKTDLYRTPEDKN